MSEKNKKDDQTAIDEASLSAPAGSEDERAAMKMMVRYKQLCRASPEKPGPDIGWMHELLRVVRESDSQNAKEWRGGRPRINIKEKDNG